MRIERISCNDDVDMMYHIIAGLNRVCTWHTDTASLADRDKYMLEPMVQHLDDIKSEPKDRGWLYLRVHSCKSCPKSFISPPPVVAESFLVFSIFFISFAINTLEYFAPPVFSISLAIRWNFSTRNLSSTWDLAFLSRSAYKEAQLVLHELSVLYKYLLAGESIFG